jgi:hypothetical protein
VEGLTADKCTFALVDFGLSVPIESWQQGGWRQQGAAGDCRYWPASAWAFFVEGASALSTSEELRKEYELALDFHSIGLSALQLFASTALAPRAGGVQQGASALELVAFELRGAWDSYWDFVMQRWREVVTGLNEGRISSVKNEMSRRNVCDAVAKHLKELHRCIDQLKTTLQNDCGEARCEQTQLLLDILLQLTGACSPFTSWDQLQASFGRDAVPVATAPAISTSLREGICADSSGDDYWASDQWDPDERVYVGAEQGNTLHKMASLPEDK